jgi:hypothetical protein
MILEQYLDSLVPILTELKRDPSAKIFYDTMSDALVWTDEAVFDGLTQEQMGSLRAIFRFRTSLILGDPDMRFEKIWSILKSRCPHWIGFIDSRCTGSKELVAKYNAHVVR